MRVLIVAVAVLSMTFFPVLCMSNTPIVYVGWTFYVKNTTSESLEIDIDTLADLVRVEDMDITVDLRVRAGSLSSQK